MNLISWEQMTILIVVIPLLSALVINMAGWMDKRYCFPVAFAALLASFTASLATLWQVLTSGTVHYRLGGWPPPFGIEYVVDPINGIILVVVSLVALLGVVFARESIKLELSHKVSQFYTLYVLLACGLLGMTVTGDAFNLYVLLEITALTSYALIAMGDNRCLVAGFNYVILGTIGASFYLLGVGHLYMMTGSLNMADLMGILPGLYSTTAVFAAFILIMAGMWIKMAFFPMHGWLPNAYTYAPSASSILMAPLVTKVSVYVMVRMMLSVFTPVYVFGYLDISGKVVWMAVIAIVAGSILALGQKDFRRMLTYLIIAEVGYMVGGAWLANRVGMSGAILHIVNDALMTLCMFMTAGILVYKTGGRELAHFKGLYRKMPLTMAAFTVGALSMIGVPPTAGFFSKWYLIVGAIEARQYHFMIALLFSSLVNAILFFRIIEIAYYEPPPEEGIDEAPVTMVLPLIITAVLLVVIGVYAGDIVSQVIDKALPVGLLG